MARENVMSTPIFDQLLREMAQRAEARPAPQQGETPQKADPEPAKGTPTKSVQRRRHRAE